VSEEGSVYEEDDNEELSDDSRSGRRKSKKQHPMSKSKVWAGQAAWNKRHRSNAPALYENNEDSPPPKRNMHDKSVKRKKKKQSLDSSSVSDSNDETPPPKKKRTKGRQKHKSRECTARANINAFVRTAVHDIHPHTTPPGRFMYWDPKVPT